MATASDTLAAAEERALIASGARVSRGRPKKRRLVVIFLLVGLLIGGALPVVIYHAESSSPSSFIPAQVITVLSGTQTHACVDIEHCAVNISVTANSALIVGTTTYADVKLTYGLHGYTLTSIEYPTASSTYPQPAIEGVIITSSATVEVWANYTAKEYYDIIATDFGNTVVTNTFYQGASSSDGDSTAGTCSVTTSVANELVYNIIGDKHTSGTVTYGLGSGQNEIAAVSTTTDIDDGEASYYQDASSGSPYAMTDTLSTSEDWRTACVGLEPTAVPTAPTSLAAGSITSTTIPLTWSVTAAQSAYLTAGEVYWASYSGSCGAFSSSAAASSPYTSYTVTGLTSGNSYCFEVTVSNTTGASADSSVLSDVTTLASPLAPTSLSAYAEAGTTTVAVVNWTVGYQTATNQTLRQSSGSSCGTPATYTNIADPVANGSVITGLSAGTTYSWEVQGWDSVGEGAWSSCISTTTYAVPAGPSSLGTTGATTSTVALSWANPSGSLVNDTVYYGTACGTWTQVSTGGVATAYTVTNLNPYLTYCFAVSAWSAGAGGPLGHPYLNVSTLAGTPGVPTYLQAPSSTSSTISLTWINPTPSSGTLINDTIEYGTSCGTWTTHVSTGYAMNSYTVTGLSTSTTYCFAVSAWTQGGESVPSSTTTGTTAGSAPGAPSSLTLVSSSRTSLSIDWAQGTGGTIVNNTVYYKASSSCTGALTALSTGGASTTFTITGLTAATQYCVVVTAWNSGGQSSQSSALVESTQGATPPAPVDLTATAVGSGWVNLIWTNPTGYTLFNNTVYYAVSVCTDGLSKVSTDGVVPSWNLTGLTPATSYCIEVTAWDDQSLPSNSIIVATTGNVPAPGGNSSGPLGGGGTTQEPAFIQVITPTGAWVIVAIAVAAGILILWLPKRVFIGSLSLGAGGVFGTYLWFTVGPPLPPASDVGLFLWAATILSLSGAVALLAFKQWFAGTLVAILAAGIIAYSFLIYGLPL
jgi:Fibronectin type III domain